MRQRFEQELQYLNDELTLMGALCETAIARSAKALLTNDKKLALSMSEITENIDQKEREVESRCLKLLMTQQPVASDLRLISAALKMVTDMKRIGVISGQIAELVPEFNTIPDPGYQLKEMALVTIRMVTDSIEAYVHQDHNLALKVIERDDEVDQRFQEIKKILVSRFKDQDADLILNVLMVAKWFEKIGDHAVNIAGWVIFSLNGKLPNPK